jgi:CRISPR/Cas system CSM-associated protein Csm3 (group 7 of RAMP superfamily)
MKGKFKSLIEKIVEKNVKNHSEIEERVGDLCHYTALFHMRALSKHECISRPTNNKKKDDR